MLASTIQLKQTEFSALSKFIYEGYGIVLPPSKKAMLEGRLQKRLKANNLHSFKAYADFVFSPKGKTEVVHMIDRVSTNKTDFFREPLHFDFLQRTLLPQYRDIRSAATPLQVWSAAASSGEEVYSLCMTMEAFRESYPNFHYKVYATDISVEKLKQALSGVYTADRLTGVPVELKRKYFLKSKDKSKQLVRVTPSLRNRVKFDRLNLMNPSLGLPESYDVIFCRNVLIYFNRKTQEEVIRKQCRTLRKGGYLFLGHSESIMGLDLPLRQVQPTVYQKI